ncbi:hypothetical protein [Streptomyces sp. JJ36]|uniref:hypothetical protein n=1 Tax=Streptomyces sp. JJ36 TaxID=2736645 RepID=UPI001F30212E|nr:hypothetical protein [Streptomyces sp. JJ36]MCF6523691.1 hypothetical protein [Streptomyces sp. JJ36]
MGSLRNPIGPLPSSIYWRRRAVALAVLLLLVLLTVWTVRLVAGDGGGEEKEGRAPNGQGPTDSITPGPSTSEPPITDRPGGRDETDGGAGSGGSDGGSAGASGGTGGGTAGAAGGGTGGTGALAGSSGGLSGGEGIPAGKSTPACRAADVTLRLTSVQNEYAPGEEPELRLTVRNTGDADCRVDLGRASAVVTVTDADDDHVWSSADCPPGDDPAYVKVPAGGRSTHALVWERERSAPGCGTPEAQRVPAGTYLVEAEIEGLETAQASFVLTAD